MIVIRSKLALTAAATVSPPIEAPMMIACPLRDVMPMLTPAGLSLPDPW
jgi:hypothetical protein